MTSIEKEPGVGECEAVCECDFPVIRGVEPNEFCSICHELIEKPILRAAVGEQQDIPYQVDCPYCGQRSYSDVDFEDWRNLDYGDGTPSGVLKCNECKKEFEMSIE